METKKLKSKLRSNGIEMEISDDKILLTPIKVNAAKFYLLGALSIPLLLFFIKYTGLSLIGILVLGAGASCLYHAIISINEINKFNSNKIEISREEITTGANIIPRDSFKHFKANMATNLFFPNIDVDIQTDFKVVPGFKIWHKNKKYLHDDKFLIATALTELFEEFSSTTPST